MTRLIIGASAAALVLTGAIATPVYAQNALEGNLTFELGRNQEKSRNFKHIATSLGTTFDNGVGVQLDLSIGKFESVTSTEPSATAHIFYAPDETWAVGVFAMGEDQRPGNYFLYGVEAKYDTGAFTGEVYAAYRDDRASGFEGERYGVEVGYAPASWGGYGMFGGAHTDTHLATGDKSIGYVGAEYGFRNNTKLALTVGHTDLKETVATLGYQIDFGRGATFSRRNSLSVYDGY